MRNSIRSRTVKFLVAQSAILAGIMLMFVFLASILFVKNAERWRLRNIEQDVLMFAQQASHAGEVPKRGDLGAYIFFVLDLEGRYILPRMPRMDDSERLWQEYELKLIYEMQKRRDGWIAYPEHKSFRWNDSQYVIRYLFLERQGWIVAAEGFLPSPASMLGGFLTPKLFLGLLAIVGIAFLLMLINAFWHFRKVMRAIVRSQQNNFIADAAPVSQEPLEKSFFIRPEESSSVNGTIRSIIPKSLPKVVREVPVLRDSVPYPRSHDSLAQPEAVPLPSMETEKTAKVSSPRQHTNSGGVSIDTGEIKSTILKRLIDQMREVQK